MSQGINTQLILAVVIVIAAAGVFGWLIYSKVRALGALRHDFDRRAPWIAVGIILAGVIIYYKTKH